MESTYSNRGKTKYYIVIFDQLQGHSRGLIWALELCVRGPLTKVHMLRSVDSVSEEDGMYHAYSVEYLQQLNASGLPPPLLCLKIGSPVILLRNLDPGEGLCNGTRMVVLNVRRKML